MKKLVAEYDAAFKYELSGLDKDVSLTVYACYFSGKVFTDAVLRDILMLLLTIPINVHTMNMHLKNLVESSNNIGILRCDDSAVTITCAIRSSVRTLKDLMRDQMTVLAKAAQADISFENDYPEWAFDVVW